MNQRKTSEGEPPLLLKKAEVASVLRVTPRQVENLTRAGRIPAPIFVAGQRSPRWVREALLAALTLPAAVEGSQR
jgi:hypothetical protein